MGNTNPGLMEACNLSAHLMYSQLKDSPKLVNSGVIVKQFVPGNVTFHIYFVRSRDHMSKILGMAIACPTDREDNEMSCQRSERPRLFETALIGQGGKMFMQQSAGYQDVKTFYEATSDILIDEIFRVRDFASSEGALLSPQ